MSVEFELSEAMSECQRESNLDSKKEAISLEDL